MNILLISPDDRKYLENAGDRPPLGVCYIARVLKDAGHKVVIADLNHDKIRKVISIAHTYNPDFIGISFTTPQYKQALDILKRLREVCTSKIIAGGVHPSLAPESCMDFDFIVKGEGERVIKDLVEGKITDKIIDFQQPADLNILPARELLDMSKYNLSIDGRRTATLISSRGCPGNCIYCSRLFGKQFRFVSSDLVFKEMLLLWNKYDYDSFYFLDDSFTADEKRLYELAILIKGNGFDKKWQIRITTRASMVNETVATLLESMGVKLVSLGIEHADNNVLKRNCKQMTIEDNEEAIRLLRRHGIKIKGFFILNLPYATKHTLRKTIKWSFKYCDYADYYSVVAFPGCSLWNFPEKFNVKLLNKDFETWEAGKHIKPNIENPEVPNIYVKKKVREAQKIWKIKNL